MAMREERGEKRGPCAVVGCKDPTSSSGQWNWLTPEEELAALEEEEEHQSWMRAFFNEPAAGLGAAVGIGIVIAVVLLTLLISGLPG